MNHKISTCLATLLVLGGSALAQQANNAPMEASHAEALAALPVATPNWLKLDGGLTVDMISNASGGIKRKTGVLEDLDLIFTIDPEKAGGWKNGLFLCYLLGNFGAKPSEYIGDLQGSDNIEAPDTVKLYEVWYEQGFLNNKVHLLGGLYDINRDFDALEYAGLFLNSSFGIAVDISQAGPSIFPTTALGVRGRVDLDNGCYLQAAALDGVPGDPGDPRGTQIILKKDDGIYNVVEGGIVHGDPDHPDYFKAGLGGWFTTTRFTDYSGSERNKNGGVYALAETSLLKKLGLFAQLGFAMHDRNQTGHYVGAGLNWANPFCAKDHLGIGVAYARNAGRFVDFNQPVDHAETAIELTYQYSLSDSCSIQPDVQYIIHPGTDKALNNALALGLRLALNL